MSDSEDMGPSDEGDSPEEADPLVGYPDYANNLIKSRFSMGDVFNITNWAKQKDGEANKIPDDSFPFKSIDFEKLREEINEKQSKEEDGDYISVVASHIATDKKNNSTNSKFCMPIRSKERTSQDLKENDLLLEIPPPSKLKEVLGKLRRLPKDDKKKLEGSPCKRLKLDKPKLDTVTSRPLVINGPPQPNTSPSHSRLVGVDPKPQPDTVAPRIPSESRDNRYAFIINKLTSKTKFISLQNGEELPEGYELASIQNEVYEVPAELSTMNIEMLKGVISKSQMRKCGSSRSDDKSKSSPPSVPGKKSQIEVIDLEEEITPFTITKTPLKLVSSTCKEKHGSQIPLSDLMALEKITKATTKTTVPASTASSPPRLLNKQQSSKNSEKIANFINLSTQIKGASNGLTTTSCVVVPSTSRNDGVGTSSSNTSLTSAVNSSTRTPLIPGKVFVQTQQKTVPASVTPISQPQQKMILTSATSTSPPTSQPQQNMIIMTPATSPPTSQPQQNMIIMTPATSPPTSQPQQNMIIMTPATSPPTSQPNSPSGLVIRPESVISLNSKSRALLSCQFCEEVFLCYEDNLYRKHLLLNHNFEITEEKYFDEHRKFTRMLRECNKCWAYLVGPKIKDHQIYCGNFKAEFVDVIERKLLKHGCGICGKFFSARYELKGHIEQFHELFMAKKIILDPEFQCASCLKRFSGSFELTKHCLNCLEKRPKLDTVSELAMSYLFCDLCCKMHPSIDETSACYLARKVLRCVLCLDIYKEKSSFYKHLHNHHGLTLQGSPKLTLPCPMCPHANQGKYQDIFPHILVEHFQQELTKPPIPSYDPPPVQGGNHLQREQTAPTVVSVVGNFNQHSQPRKSLPELKPIPKTTAQQGLAPIAPRIVINTNRINPTSIPVGAVVTSTTTPATYVFNPTSNYVDVNGRRMVLLGTSPAAGNIVQLPLFPGNMVAIRNPLHGANRSMRPGSMIGTSVANPLLRPQPAIVRPRLVNAVATSTSASTLTVTRANAQPNFTINSVPSSAAASTSPSSFSKPIPIVTRVMNPNKTSSIVIVRPTPNNTNAQLQLKKPISTAAIVRQSQSSTVPNLPRDVSVHPVDGGTATSPPTSASASSQPPNNTSAAAPQEKEVITSTSTPPTS